MFNCINNNKSNIDTINNNNNTNDNDTDDDDS